MTAHGASDRMIGAAPAATSQLQFSATLITTTATPLAVRPQIGRAHD